jgi:tRNA 2-thiouridine synthesizing protein D
MATLTILLMDPPYASATSTTALRIVDAAIRKGHNVNVMAYEGAVAATFTAQKAHGNPIKGTSADEETHPLPKDCVAALLEAAAERGVKLDWIRCGLSEDERGVHEAQLAGTRRGSAVEFYLEQVVPADNVLVIPTR